MDARSKTQPKKLSEPAKKPTTRPELGPGVTEAQW